MMKCILLGKANSLRKMEGCLLFEMLRNELQDKVSPDGCKNWIASLDPQCVTDERFVTQQ